jgi:glycosyltransferase involved in cell wall biosynthesis
MSMPLVSIIVPLFNKEKFILDCLFSIANQEYSNWECIIVDDGSSDQSVFLVEKFAKAAPGDWKILRKQNGGPSSARNYGIRHAHGEFIAFLDADDVWLPNKITCQLDILGRSPAALMALSDYLILEQDSSKMRAVRNSRSPQLLGKWLDMRGFGGLVESTGLVRQSVFEKNVFFDETHETGEGLDFMLQIAKLGEFIVVPEFLTVYRLSEGQLHKNEELVQKNMRILTKKYASDDGEREVIDLWQLAYFDLSSIRSFPKSQILVSLMRRAVRMEFKVLAMALSILTRNILAKLVSRKTKRRVRSTLRRLTTQVVNLLP